MAITSPQLIYPGAIVHVVRFPFHEDSRQSKSRFGLVVSNQANSVVVRGIYSNPYRGRQIIRATPGSGLRHDSYLDSRLVEIRRNQISRYVGETPYDYDPFGDFAA